MHRAQAFIAATPVCRRSHCRPPRRRPRIRAAHGNPGGVAVLASATLFGLLSRRVPQLPSSARGEPVAFLLGALLRTLAPRSAQLASDAVLAGAPAGVALLLLRGARVGEGGGALGAAFAVGAAGSVVGAATGAVCVARAGLATPGACAALAAVFAATYVGGSLNFVAVAAAARLAQVAPGALAAAVAADVALMAAYFAVLFVLAARVNPSAAGSVGTAGIGVSCVSGSVAIARGAQSAVARNVGAVLLACALYGASRAVCGALKLGGGADVVIVSVLAMCARRVVGVRADTAADVAVTLFFAALGAGVSVADIGMGGGGVFVLCFITLVVHALFMSLAWRMGGIPGRECLVASNANVGGPTTAAAFAAAQGWTALVAPAAFVGAVGYAIATPIALLLLYVLQRTL